MGARILVCANYRSGLMNMQYNAAGLLKDSVGSEREIAFEDENIQDALVAFSAVKGRARLLRTDRGILVQANIQGHSTDVCSRCLDDTDVEYDEALEEEFYPTNHFEDLPEGFDPRDPTDAEETPFLIDEDNILDLREAVRQTLISATPMAATCKDDCKGICSICSTDRNISPCECDQENETPLWAESLKSLKLR